jgi:hypothetical protein
MRSSAHCGPTIPSSILDRRRLPVRPGVFVSQVSKAGYYVDANHAREALRQRRQFNVIDAASGWKADLIVRKERAFSREEFRRRLPAKVLGVDLWRRVGSE